MVGKLWRYRSFVIGMTRREFHARYLGSALGAVWALLSPLAMIFIYTVVFGRVMHARLPGLDDGMSYGIFLCAGVLTWGLFTEVMQRSVGVFVENGNLLKKMSFPRSTLPAVVILSATVNFAIVVGLLLVVLVFTGRFPGWALLGFIPLLALQQSIAIGLGVALGVLNVFFRDVAHALGIILQLWFWLTPIVYPLSVLPQRARPWIELNPMTELVVGYQRILVDGLWPHWSSYLPHVVLACAALAFGRLAYRRLAGEMPDNL